MSPALERCRRIVYSCFIVTNLCVIVYCNLPHTIGDQITSDLALLEAHFYTQADQAKTMPEYNRRLGLWKQFRVFRQVVAHADRYPRLYAHYVGLDNRWQMFGLQNRFNWRYVIKGHYTDGTRHQTLVLDLPRQSKQSGVPRTFWQYHFFDFREGKFHLNMYQDPYARAAYSRYLARQYTHYEGLPIESIEIELHYQYIKQPAEARRTGNHMHPEVHSFVYNRFSAQGELEPQRSIYSLPMPSKLPASEQLTPASDGQQQSEPEVQGKAKQAAGSR